MFHFCDCSMGYVAPHPLTFPHCPVCCVSCLGKQKEGMMIVCRKFHFHNAFSIVKSNFLLRVGFGHPLENEDFSRTAFCPTEWSSLLIGYFYLRAFNKICKFIVRKQALDDRQFSVVDSLS